MAGRKLILKCAWSPGDMVMLTAAVRDLHLHYPRQFLTDVRTRCPEIWENNPYLTPLEESERGVEVVECSYPLINGCNEAPYHCLHGFIEFLNQRLSLQIKPTAFKGDLHLARREKSWMSQVQEATGKDIPFWIVAAGGKYDIPIKWWDTRRYQQVVDYFAGKIQFVQVGDWGHHHPPLKGVIDLRGRTSLRELIRLVYHAQGVLCPVTALMHLAAAVEVKDKKSVNRPCVVVAGGREPAHWEAYPGHQFIHANDALPCCRGGGCWKDRVHPLGDGDERDRPAHLCRNIRQGLPRCMDLITAGEVIRRIELYFKGGQLSYLSRRQQGAARRGMAATAHNGFDAEPLNLHNARLACKNFLETLPDHPPSFRGRGIVICGGGVTCFTNAWVCINILRRLGCRLPIQLWHLGAHELDARMAALVAPLGVECVDAQAMLKQHPARIAGGWELKPYAILHGPFEQVLYLDADNVPVANPEYLFEIPEFKTAGAVFWPDYGQLKQGSVIWKSCGMPRPPGPEFESGQILVDKRRCWRALRLCLWFNEHSYFYYQHLHGDKETFHLAFRKLGHPFALVRKPIHRLDGTMCQHDFQGRRLFQHRNSDKWNLFARNLTVPDFWLEAECREYLEKLRQAWDGRAVYYQPGKPAWPSNRHRPAPRIQAIMISCPERDGMRRQTLRNLAATDWGEAVAFIQMDESQSPHQRERQAQNTFRALRRSLQLAADYYLFLEDDLDFNRHLRRNLEHWLPLRSRWVNLAGLYNPGLRIVACNVRENYVVVEPQAVFGSQAVLLARSTARFLVKHWEDVDGLQDIRMSRLAGQLKKPIFYHAPSLVQHRGQKSTWGGRFHQAIDFDRHWMTGRGCIDNGSHYPPKDYPE